MGKTVVPTMFDTGKREGIPNLEPGKRVGGGEYTTPTPNTTELVEDSGLWERGLNAAGVKSLRQEKAEEAKRKADKLTKANVEPLGKEPPGFMDRFMSKESNPLLDNITSSDIKNITIDGNEVGFDSGKAMNAAAKALGVYGDFSNLGEKDLSELGKLAEQFTSNAGYNGLGDAFGVLGRVADGITTFTEAGNNATGVMGLIGAITGESELFDFLDLGGEAAFIHSLVNLAIKYNIPEYIDKLTGMVYNNELQQQSLEMNLSYAAVQCNYEVFDKLWEHLWDDLRSKNRDKYLRELISNFKVKDGEHGPSKINHMLSVMNYVGPGWDKDPEDGSLPYIYYYSFASKPAVELFNLMEDRYALGWAGYYAPARTTEEIVRSTVPGFTL